MSTKSKFKSERLTGRRLTLRFERIGDTFWTDATKLRELVAELDRLTVPGDADIQLQHRTANDELGPVGWSLNLTTTEGEASVASDEECTAGPRRARVDAAHYASRLLPEGGEERTERSWSHADGTDCVAADRGSSCLDAVEVERRVVGFPDGSEFVQPWREVDAVSDQEDEFPPFPVDDATLDLLRKDETP